VPIDRFHALCKVSQPKTQRARAKGRSAIWTSTKQGIQYSVLDTHITYSVMWYGLRQYLFHYHSMSATTGIIYTLRTGYQQGETRLVVILYHSSNSSSRWEALSDFRGLKLTLTR
jgi:hypothetical protein